MENTIELLKRNSFLVTFSKQKELSTYITAISRPDTMAIGTYTNINMNMLDSVFPYNSKKMLFDATRQFNSNPCKLHIVEITPIGDISCEWKLEIAQIIELKLSDLFYGGEGNTKEVEVSLRCKFLEIR